MPIRTAPVLVAWPTRWCFLLFIASIPLEYAYPLGNSDSFTISKVAGMLLAIVALIQPTVSFAKPPKAFWFFAGYLCVYSLRGLLRLDFGDVTLTTIFTQFQCTILLWISYNIFRYGGIQRRVFVVLLLSNGVVAVAASLGIGSSIAEGREAAFGQNQNELAFLYVVGLLSGVALATDKTVHSYWRLLTVPLILLLAVKCVTTGSRGGLVCVAAGILTYGMSVRGIGGRLKGVVVVGVVGALFGYMVLKSDVTRERLQETFQTGNVAGRDKIFRIGWAMFLDKPIFGWGPTTHLEEIARREGAVFLRTRYRDTHNDIMYVLTATGLSGIVFFCGALWLCVWAGWKGRQGPAGPFPLALMICALVMGMSGTMQRRKPIWIISAMALASGAAVANVRAPRTVVRPAFLPRRSGV